MKFKILLISFISFAQMSLSINSRELNVSDKKTPHLKDTTISNGTSIIFLRPDSRRFKYFEKHGSEEIVEIDSDFGFGINDAIDSVKSKKEFARIKTTISDKRFIKYFISPSTFNVIDRDTINYGIILIDSKKAPLIKSFDNEITSFGEYYFEIIKTYFQN